MQKHYTPELCRRLEPELKTFLEKAEAIRWSPASIAYDKIDRSKLTTADLFGVYVTLHIENYSDVYTSLLLAHHEDAPELRSFIVNWEREEENHARVLERYLTTLGIGLDELKKSYALVDKNDFPFPTPDQAGLNVFVFFQELLTREMYTKMLKACREPVLVDILKRVVRDEERHYRFYKHSLGLRFELDRRDTFRQFRRIIRRFTMPQTMFQQTAMTDRLVTYYHYSLEEILAIAKPVIKFLEASPSPWLERFPRLQRLWVQRRTALYLAQSPYLWTHVLASLRLFRPGGRHVEQVVRRLEGLMAPTRAATGPSTATAPAVASL